MYAAVCRVHLEPEEACGTWETCAEVLVTFDPEVTEEEYSLLDDTAAVAAMETVQREADCCLLLLLVLRFPVAPAGGWCRRCRCRVSVATPAGEGWRSLEEGGAGERGG